MSQFWPLSGINEQGAVHKVRHAILANFYPPSPVTLRHTSRDPPKVRHTSRTPPIFRKPSTKSRTKAPVYKFCLNCSQRILSGGFVRVSFVWKFLSVVAFVRSCSVRIVYICYNRNLNITLNFMLRMYDNKNYKCDTSH